MGTRSVIEVVVNRRRAHVVNTEWLGAEVIELHEQRGLSTSSHRTPQDKPRRDREAIEDIRVQHPKWRGQTLLRRNRNMLLNQDQHEIKSVHRRMAE
jgi:hypothetical protein